MFQRLAIFLLLVALAPALLAGDGDYKVEPLGALTAAGVSEAVRGTLEAKGLRVVGGDGKAVCEVWFRKEVPTAAAEAQGAAFGQLQQGALAGVIHFPAPVYDYRGQAIKPGHYTLRYALILNDGNHLGVSPTPDFFLLCPVAEDKDPTVQFNAEDLARLSRTAAGASHPSPWNLVPPTSREGLPKVIKTAEEHVILETRLTTKSGPLPIGLTVIGKTEG
jgi:hypothetical protein